METLGIDYCVQIYKKITVNAKKGKQQHNMHQESYVQERKRM